MEVGLEVAGRYRAERLLGRGAFGEVWAAMDQLRDRRVAVKFLQQGVSTSNPVVLAKFRQEAKIAAQLEHPGITRVDDFGEHGGQWFLVMEYLQGRDLASELADHPGGLPVERVVSLGVQLAEALVAAHGTGVVHRDLKPANLMVVAGDRLKVCDFGIARIADSATVQTFAGRVGTPVYMAPEQWSGDPVDHRTDLYAVGGILFTLLCGRPPFTSERLEGLMGQHLGAEPPRVRDLRPEVPAALDELIAELLAKDPAQRPGQTSDVLDRLRRLQQAPAAWALPPAAPPPPPPPPPPAVPAQRTAPPAAPPATVDANGARESSPARRSARRPSRRAVLTVGALTLAAAAAGGSAFFVLTYEDPGNLARLELQTTLTGHEGPVSTVVFSRSNNLLASADSGVAKVWDATTGKLLTTIDGHKSTISTVVFDPDGRRLATIGEDHTVKMWDVTNGRHLFTLTGHKGRISSLVFDGFELATTSEDHTARVWNAHDGRHLHTLTGHKGPVLSASFRPGGASVLATAGADGTVKIWDLQDDGRLLRTLTEHRGAVSSVAFNTKGEILATAGADHTARLWRAETGHLLHTLTGHRGPVSSVEFDKYPGDLITIGGDGVKTWEVTSGKPLVSIAGRGSRIRSAVIDSIGFYVATVGDGPTAELWRTDTGRHVFTLTGHKGQVSSVSFDPPGNAVATAGSDGTVRLWRVPER